MNRMGLDLKNGRTTKAVMCMAVLLACVGLTTTASSNAVVPDDQKALLTVRGQGANPFAQISLSTGPQQVLTTKADKSGQFVFSNLKYASFSDLKFSIDIPPYAKGLSDTYPATHLDFRYNVKESMAYMSGQIGRYGTLALNLGGAKDTPLRVAGAEGYVSLQTRSSAPMVSGNSILTASIVNAGEICCPKLIVPATPITLTIFSQALAAVPPVPQVPNKRINIPNVVMPTIPAKPADTTNDVPASVAPAQENAPAKPAPYILLPKEAPKQQGDKPKVPYIVQGRIDVEMPDIVSDDIVAATSFSSADYDNTYVGGLKKMADEARNTVILAMGAMGAFLDGRTFMDTTRSLQVSSVQTLRKYTASDQVCKFGTMSKSLAGADSVVRSNHMGFSKILTDRNVRKMNTLFSNPSAGLIGTYTQFKKKHCNENDNNGFLKGYCDAATATSDVTYNRDVDFTRVFDVPLTIDADFSDSDSVATSKDKQAVIALFANLSKIPPVMGSDKEAWDPRDNAHQAQDIRALSALKTVSANSFAALVAEKAKATSQSTTYMKDVLLQLGLSDPDATKLLGANPSYFAQMEMMTKKLFQNPAFYANLYDSEENVDRQRVAMKAIELQQDRDFLESLRRREMLLSVLLNAKLKVSASSASESGTVTQ